MTHNTHEHKNGDACCSTRGPGYGVCQSLLEMEFERGIWYAAQSNDVERVESLLRKGNSSNAEDSAGYTALHYAARNGHYEICKLLLKNGAKVDACTRCARATSLHRAAAQGHEIIVTLLLNSGANADLVDDDGCTALHRAILFGSVPACRLLLPKTNLGIANNAGLTPSQLATKKGNLDIVSLFEKYSTA